MADELKALEKKIKKEYALATAELKVKSREYMEQYKERWEQEYKAYQAGKYTHAEFIQWEMAQIGRGQHWEALKDQMASRMLESSEIASAYINDTLPIAYTKASNQVANLARKSAIAQGVTGIRFDLVDENVIRRLMLENVNVITFKTSHVNPSRQYKWDAKRIQNALTQGILQGDSIDRIADRFLVVMENDKKSAVRNARTAVTSARSVGKQDRYEDLASQGCEITKIWIATIDDRTRDTHAEIDGEEVAYDEPFLVRTSDGGIDKMMYPCDPDGSPENVYNCRCTMRTGKIRFKSVLSDEAKAHTTIRIS